MQQTKNRASQPQRHPRKLLRRDARREAILTAATKAFVRNGYAATSLDDIAKEAEVTRAILYRHFESKRELYEVILERVRGRFVEPRAGAKSLDKEFIRALATSATEDPDGFKLYYYHAVREPEFRSYAERTTQIMKTKVEEYLKEVLQAPNLRTWAAELLPGITIQTILAWLNAGKPAEADIVDVIYKMIIDTVKAIKATQKQA